MVSSKAKLAFTLDIYKNGRRKLISDFVKQNPELFIPMFKYENEKHMITLTQEQYLTNWLNHHYLLVDEAFKKIAVPSSIEIEIKEYFINSFISLLQKMGTLMPRSEYEFLNGLLKKKIDFLEDLIATADKSTEAYNKIMLEYEKDKACFRREFTRLEKLEYGNW